MNRNKSFSLRFSFSLGLGFSWCWCGLGAWPFVWASCVEIAGSLNPRAVIGSVGDSWIVRGLGKEVREVEEEKIDWSRCL